MSAKKVIGIIAGSVALLAAAGAGLFVYGYEEPKNGSVSISEFSELSVDATSADIILKKGSENKVSYQVPERLIPEIKEENGKLTLTSNSKNKKHINFCFKRTYIEITMTEEALEAANIHVTSGDVKISGIDWAGSIKATSGDIEVSGSESGGDLDIKATSGDLKIENCVFGRLTCNQTSGDAKLSNVQSGSVSMSSTSGDVSAKKLNADEISVKSTSGDADMTLTGKESDYKLNLSATSGDIKVGNHKGSRYQSGEGQGTRSVEVHATSGDITIRFAE